MLQFYMTPGSCSTGIHILLEELELLFGVNLVNLQKGDHLQDSFKQINPKSTIPVLVTSEGKALCDFLSIAWWLANEHPKAKLLPENNIDLASCIEFTNYVTNTIHGKGFTRIFTADKYALREQDNTDIIAKGREIVEQSFAIIEAQLVDDYDYVFEHFTIADSALFYVLFWADRSKIQLPTKCQQLYARLLKRRAVSQVLAEEGYRFHLT